MKEDPVEQTLKPFDFSQILAEVPELGKFAHRIDSYTFTPLIDSSDVEPKLWVSIAELIERKYDEYDGFVILHGTDTMAYSASALSFMIEGLTKPVIFTGSQLPIGVPRTDGKENLPVPEDESPMKILIGPENVSDALKDTSVVVASYDIGDDMRGLIGVVGPTRMDYAKVTARLSYFAESLSKMFAKPEQASLPEGEEE